MMIIKPITTAVRFDNYRACNSLYIERRPRFDNIESKPAQMWERHQ